MKVYNIAVIKGDGIGPEIINEGMKVLEAAADVCGEKINYTEYPYGAEHYLKSGEVLPDSAIEEFKQHDAVYFGATGSPLVKPGVLETGLVLKMRFDLDQYINLRPVKLYPNVVSPIRGLEELDFYMVRENIEDFYNGMGTVFKNDGIYQKDFKVKRKIYEANFRLDATFDVKDDYSVSMGMLSRKNTKRVMDYSFELAMKKGKKLVSAVDKSNVIPDLYSIWREEFSKTALNYPEMKTEFVYADAMAMFLVDNPSKYGVIVLPNLMGDILTDLGAAVSGGLGFAAGANINPNGVSLFEPIHGSAPDIAGKGLANPVATIISGAMMMDNIGSALMHDMIDSAVCDVLKTGMFKTADMGGKCSTAEFGNAVCESIKKLYR